MPVSASNRVVFACVLAACLISPSFGRAAVVVGSHGFEGNTSLGAGINLGAFATEMSFNGTFGDQTAANHMGLLNDSTLARTGNNAYVIDLGSNIDFPPGTNSHGFGGNFSGLRYDLPPGSFDANTVFNVSAYFAENPADLITGGSSNLHFEFYDASGSLVFRNDSFGLASTFNGGVDNGDATPDYTQIVNTYRLGEAIANSRLDNAMNPITTATLDTIVSARAIITGNNGGNTGGGQIFVDDFTFTVTAVPEPNALAIVATTTGGLLIRRRRR